MPFRSSQPKGFTLIELGAVMLLVGLLYALVFPRFSDITGLKLKSTARKVSSMIKYAYDEAVSKNKKTRMVFDFEEGANQIWIEEWTEKSPTQLLLIKGTEDDEEKSSDEKESDEAPKGEFVRFEDKFTTNLKLPSYVKIKGIYFAREDRVIDKDSVKLLERESKDVENEKTASIVFLPSGYTEDSIVYLSDLKERVYSIKINPLTGRPTVYNSYVQPEKI